MITYQITRFIHSVIRSNKLVHLVDALLEKSHQNENILDDLIVQFKRFLQKGNDEIFEQNRLKYVTYLDDFKTNISDIKNLDKQDSMQVNSLLLEIYEIPKKRNNLLSGFLLYFYLRNHKHLQGEAIFKIIYLYFLIITYRNRLDDSMRANIIKIDDTQLRSLSNLFVSTLHRIRRRYHLPSSRLLVMMSILLCVTVFSAVSWQYVPLISNLQADVTAVGQGTGVSDGFVLGKVAMDSILLGRLTDGVNGTLQGFGLQNILIVALMAVIFQSLRTGFTNLFVNSFLVKTFAAVGTILKIVFHAIFAIYNYVIYKLSTRYIFTAIDFTISRRILPGPALLSLSFVSCIFSSI
ncbi:MAG: hypothetical protein ACD_78C00320G0012 [uncultured bacterium (gcode 4)]|uniref:Uncharacterized protein n=1 Tax=uncultured bacterium (gcode 4) TaxID=1234023 RepID=K1YBG9_9BACT|nr:MAG: hypothetical protein ACD_78C00320G0012 [uncultured bacterium (gcode 4)]HBB26976.1 hypothetical protein [Candidatus Gracilibacteria bacterium]